MLNILRCGVKWSSSNRTIFQNRYIFCVILLDAIQTPPFHSCIQKTQSISCCRKAAIRSALTLSATFSTSHVSLFLALLSTRLQYWWWFDIILTVPKYILQTEHIRFFKLSLTAGLNTLYEIPREYFHWTNVEITLLIATVCCNDRSWLVFTELVHLNPLSRLWDMPNEGGRNLSFTKLLHDNLRGIQHAIMLHLTICNKYWDNLIRDNLNLSLSSLTNSDLLSPIYLAITE